MALEALSTSDARTDRTGQTGRVLPRAVVVFLVFSAFCLLAEGAILFMEVPAYILPAPSRVFSAIHGEGAFLLAHAGITAVEIVVGLMAGAAFGIVTALLMALSPRLMSVLQPVLTVSQALPVFAIAPLLVIWLGFGLASKIAMAGLIIYFPVAVAFLDGLRRTDDGLLDLARLNDASALQSLFLIRIPAALPYLATGLKVAATVAPIGAIVGEWVGASGGLGFIMLQANARMETNMLFAALVILAMLALLVRFGVDWLCRVMVPWQSEN